MLTSKPWSSDVGLGPSLPHVLASPWELSITLQGFGTQLKKGFRRGWSLERCSISLRVEGLR